jgi:hypothetical protein
MMTLEQLIENIVPRPHMWVEDGSFAAAAAFISGYDWAVQSHLGIDKNETELGRFRTWLAAKAWEKDGFPRNLSWEVYIKREVADDETEFTILLMLYKQFQSAQE